MITEYILLKTDNILNIKELVESLVSGRFEFHESDYWGEYFIIKDIGNIKNIRIMHNYVDDNWQFEEDTDCDVVVEIENTEYEQSLVKRLEKSIKEYIKVVYIIEISDNKIRKYKIKDGDVLKIFEKERKVWKK